jgi:hypothetical protein
MKTRISLRAAVSATAAAAFIVAITVSPANATSSETNAHVVPDVNLHAGQERPGLFPVKVSSSLEISEPVREPRPGEISPAASEGIWDLQLTVPDVSVNTYEWLPDRDALRIYSAEGDAYWAPLLEKFFPSQAVEIAPAVHSKAEIDAVMEIIGELGGDLGNGQRIVTAIPAKDGSEISLGIASARAQARVSESEASLLLDTVVPLVIEEAPLVSAVGRNNSGLYSFVAGNRMNTPASEPGQQYGCSTGFMVGNNAFGTIGMISADHCGSGKPSTSWYYSTAQTRSLGTYPGQLPGQLLPSDLAIWTGGEIATKYIPAVYVGDHNNATSADWIRGANFPAVGTDVCYSGARSGNVCDNEVLFQGVTACYAVLQCYQGLTWTSQRSSIEAAGNGDSGGPVYQFVDGKLNASGLISGIVGGSQTCTGDPGSSTRSCSPVALFAPVAWGVIDTGWGVAYIQGG